MSICSSVSLRISSVLNPDDKTPRTLSFNRDNTNSASKLPVSTVELDLAASDWEAAVVIVELFVEATLPLPSDSSVALATVAESVITLLLSSTGWAVSVAAWFSEAAALTLSVSWPAVVVSDEVDCGSSVVVPVSLDASGVAVTASAVVVTFVASAGWESLSVDTALGALLTKAVDASALVASSACTFALAKLSVPISADVAPMADTLRIL